MLSSVGSGLLGQGTDTGSLHGDCVFAIGGDKLHLRVVIPKRIFNILLSSLHW